MADLSFAEVSAASRNAMLAAKVSKTIRQAKRAGSLDERGQEILARGAQLLSEVVQGSLLIEGKHVERSSRADLKAYSHAISALGLLKLAAKEKDLTKVFEAYKHDLLTLSRGGRLRADRIEKLGKFFALLNEFFFRDVQRVPPPIRAEPEPVLSLLP